MGIFLYVSFTPILSLCFSVYFLPEENGNERDSSSSSSPVAQQRCGPAEPQPSPPTTSPSGNSTSTQHFFTLGPPVNLSPLTFSSFSRFLSFSQLKEGGSTQGHRGHPGAHASPIKQPRDSLGFPLPIPPFLRAAAAPGRSPTLRRRHGWREPELFSGAIILPFAAVYFRGECCDP